MAASKSVSRRSAAKKASKTRKSRAAAKKAAKTRKQRAAGEKAAATHKRRTAAKKALPRKSKVPPAIAEIDDRIAIIRDNLRELTEQAAASSGASDEELMSQRIAEQEAKLEFLRRQREQLALRGW
jgi:hypothetical protein